MSKKTTKKRSQSAKTKARQKTGNRASIKAKARKRQRQKLILTGVLAVVLIIVCVVAIFVLGGFGSKTANENSVYILENGKVVSTNVEEFDEDDYSKSELKSYMKEIIDNYNSENGSGLVKQQSFNIKDGMATSVLQYADAATFEDFFGTELFVGTIEEAMAAGYTFDIPFASVSNGVKEVNSDDFINDETYKVAIIKANTKLIVEGTIYYISTENIEEVGSDYVITKEASVLEMEMIESTEAEAVDSAVSDDDLLSEEGGMVFDFGEEVVPVRDYTEVYTYIIYK